MKKLAHAAIFLFIGVSFVLSETTTFEHVKIRRHKSTEKRELVDKVGVLSFDDDARELTFHGEAGDKFAVLYSDITKVVFDSYAHASTWIAGVHVRDHWLYLEYSQNDQSEKVLLVLPAAIYAKAIAKTQSLFGERVTVVDYPEKGKPIDKSRVPDVKSKHSLKLDRTNHPLPEVKPDKATVVVVCPPAAARGTGGGNQFKLHANGKVIAVNKWGTYSIAYLDPGKYSLISQSENANGFDMDLEGGRTYYFIQETFIPEAFVLELSGKLQTMLSRNSAEVVMYLVDGAYFSNWKRLN